MPEMAPVRALKGMKDVLWPASYRWEVLVATFAGLAQRAARHRLTKVATIAETVGVIEPAACRNVEVVKEAPLP